MPACSGISGAPRIILHLCDALHGKMDGPDKQCRAASSGLAGEGHQWPLLFGAVWGLRQTTGAGATSIPGDECLRFSDGRQHPCCEGLHRLTCSLHRAKLPRQRANGFSHVVVQEDPPAAIFQNRQLSATSRAGSFAPLADQRWVTCGLAFLKEMEVITSKRNELAAGPKFPSETSSKTAPKQKPKANPKRKGREKGRCKQRRPRHSRATACIRSKHREGTGVKPFGPNN